MTSGAEEDVAGDVVVVVSGVVVVVAGVGVVVVGCPGMATQANMGQSRNSVRDCCCC